MQTAPSYGYRDDFGGGVPAFVEGQRSLFRFVFWPTAFVLLLALTATGFELIEPSLWLKGLCTPPSDPELAGVWSLLVTFVVGPISAVSAAAASISASTPWQRRAAAGLWLAIFVAFSLALLVLLGAPQRIASFLPRR